MNGRYLGQNYDPSTPIRPDALETARAWDARVTSARMFLRVQQREMHVNGWHINSPQNLARQDLHCIERGAQRSMEHTRR